MDSSCQSFCIIPSIENIKELHHSENINAEDVVLLWAAYQSPLQKLRLWLVGERTVVTVIELPHVFSQFLLCFN